MTERQHRCAQAHGDLKLPCGHLSASPTSSILIFDTFVHASVWQRRPCRVRDRTTAVWRCNFFVWRSGRERERGPQLLFSRDVARFAPGDSASPRLREGRPEMDRSPDVPPQSLPAGGRCCRRHQHQGRSGSTGPKVLCRVGTARANTYSVSGVALLLWQERSRGVRVLSCRVLWHRRFPVSVDVGSKYAP